MSDQYSPLPWHVEYSRFSHVKGSQSCLETCGAGRTPLRIEQQPLAEVHVMHWDDVDDVISADGKHVICFGHDYDDYGSMSVADAKFIVRACNSHDELLTALKELRDVAAAWCRVSMNHPGLAEELHAEVQQIGIADGFGVRAQAAIAKAESR